jgi:hypothetical protein
MYQPTFNLQRAWRRKEALKIAAILAFIVVLLVSLFVVFYAPLDFAYEGKGDPFYFGVSFCANTTAEAKLLIDRICGYTNLFVLQSWPLRFNETAVYEVCDYATGKGLSIIVNLGTRTDNATWLWHMQVWRTGTSRWGDKFLGAYYDDEPGGAQIDYDWTWFFEQRYNYSIPTTGSTWMRDVYKKWLDWRDNGTQPQDYDAETAIFLNYFTNPRAAFQELKRSSIKTFISDYALHWFDYKGGYDVVLAQFGSNNSVPRAIQQVRGAARLQNKEWGAIITWKYMQPPYLAGGDEIYDQMLSAYQAGAKYVVLFDYPQLPDNPYGVLEDQHFAALERFSQTVEQTSRTRTISKQAMVALVLPTNYGFGLRRHNDRIWGYWGPDNKTEQVWTASQTLLNRFGLDMDLVYDDPEYPISDKYATVYFWNQSKFP